MTRQDVLQLLLERRARQDAVDEVGPIERADELDRIVQPELRGDVVADARRGGRGVGVQADARQQLRAAVRAAGTPAGSRAPTD